MENLSDNNHDFEWEERSLLTAATAQVDATGSVIWEGALIYPYLIRVIGGECRLVWETVHSQTWSLRENFADSEDTDPRRSHPGVLSHWCKLDAAFYRWNFCNQPEIVWNDMRGFWDSRMIARRCCFDILKNIKITSLVREMHTSIFV
jgi:hypothetical protein